MVIIMNKNENIINNCKENIINDLEKVNFLFRGYGDNISRLKYNLIQSSIIDLDVLISLYKKITLCSVDDKIKFIIKYPYANKTELLEILQFLIVNNIIQGFGKKQRELHISDFKKKSEIEIRSFLQQKGIDQYLIELQDINTNNILENLKQKIVLLYTLLCNIPNNEWNLSENKPQKMVEIYQKFEQKQLIESITYNTLGSLSFKIKIPENQNIKTMCELSGVYYNNITYYEISMINNTYELHTLTKRIPLTEEIINFFLSL